MFKIKKHLYTALIISGVLLSQGQAVAEEFDRTKATLLIMLTQKYNKDCARWSKNKFPEKLEQGIDVNTRPRLAHTSECIAKLSKRDPQYKAMLKKHAKAESLKQRGFIEYDLQF